MYIPEYLAMLFVELAGDKNVVNKSEFKGTKNLFSNKLPSRMNIHNARKLQEMSKVGEQKLFFLNHFFVRLYLLCLQFSIILTTSTEKFGKNVVFTHSSEHCSNFTFSMYESLVWFCSYKSAF